MSCYRGWQDCSDGVFGVCSDGRITTEPLPARGRGRLEDALPQALSSPTSCTSGGMGGAPAAKFDNPCDPGCMYFDEVKELVPDPTPAVLGPLPDWSAPVGTAPCSHALCDTGAPLDAVCHPCVARVCAVDDSCCSGPSADAWDADCVDLVFSECSSEPPPESVSFCDYAAFGETYVRLGSDGAGRPNIGSNGWVRPEQYAQVGTIHARQYVTVKQNTVVDGEIVTERYVEIDAPASVSGDIWAGEYVKTGINVSLGGDVTAADYIEIESDNVVYGDLWSGSFIDLSGDVEIHGDARAVGDILGPNTTQIHGAALVEPPSTISSVLQIDGGASELGTVTAPPSPALDFPSLSDLERDLSVSCSVASAKSGTYVGGVTTLPPGVYGDYTVNGAGRLRLLDTGPYIFDRFRMNNGSELWLDGDGPWDISSCEDFHTDANVKIYLDGTTTTPDPQDFLVYADDTSGDCIYIGDSNELNGIFIAPKCTVRAYNHSQITAALWGNRIYTNGSFGLSNIPWADCEGVSHFGSALCGSTRLYTDGDPYGLGDRVHFGGNIYECAAPAWCSSGGGYGGAPGYWPGQGASWDASAGGAWYLVGACPSVPSNPVASPPPSCPVSLVLPETPAARGVCQSGRDCQVNSRCTEVTTDAACAHSKCLTGAALDSICDPCVRMICAEAPTCCADSGGLTWDASCVALVPTVCDASCGDPSAPLLPESGLCVENGETHQVPANVCPHVDLAVGRSCADLIQVCNHGQTPVAAGEAELAFYPRAGQQFATEDPDEQWLAGTCSVTSAIAPGGCVQQVCDSALLSQDHTVRVQLTSGALSTECSQLDNWSYYQDENVCAGLAATVEIQAYEGICPEGSQPSWGFLIWDTTLEGDAEVAFEARTSRDGVFSGPFVEVGRASGSTSTCFFTSADATCPVDLTDVLGLSASRNQPPHLELRITLLPSGSDAPTVHDWGLTYSCQVSE